jgi:recombination protein RecA
MVARASRERRSAATGVRRKPVKSSSSDSKSAPAEGTRRVDHDVVRVFPESIIAQIPSRREPGAKGEDMSTVKPNEKWRAVETALTQIERQFGKGSIMRLGDRPDTPISVIPTGSLAVDAALGVGGIPRGRVVEIFGPEASGKTTLSLQIIAQAQRTGGLAGFIDAEHALDADYAKKLGVDTENLLVSQPDNGEQALEIAEMLIRSGAIDVIVVDSVAALVPKAEIEGEMGEAQMGLQARLMSQALRKLTAIVSKSRTSLIFINQIREKIGVMFGNPETTTGGRALKFYSSIRIDIRRIASLKDGDVVVGSRTKVKVVKNKVASPFRQAEFDINYGEGISRAGELIDLGLEAKVVDKSGAWLSYGDLRIGQGRENAKQFLKENPELAAEIEAKLRKALGLTPVESAPKPALPPSAVAEAAREKEKARRTV